MNVKTVIQDILNTLLVFSLVGMAMVSSLQPLVQPKTMLIIVLVLGAAHQLVYYADMIFGFPNTSTPTPPNSPIV